MYNSYNNRPQWNPYISHNMLDDRFVAAMKAQERSAIQAIISAQTLKVASEAPVLMKNLKERADQMKKFASESLVTHLEEALTGQAAEAAKAHLQNIQRIEFQAPVKGV